MGELRQEDYLAIAEVTTERGLRAEALRLARKLGFETVSLTAVLDRSDGDYDFFSVDNTPIGYFESFNDPERGRLDPVSQHCKHSHLPIVWDQATYVNADKGELWEHQASFGYRTGISVAHHLSNGRHLLLGVDTGEALPEPNSIGRIRLVAGVQMFATYALDVTLRLILPAENVRQESVGLTRRELEVLSWTMEGKTAWEIGRILGIAENTVVRHAHNAARKLGCSSKHHAVVKALRLRLIQ
jgi:DNA-binding CsgD family transcriptional regulator